MKSMAIIFNFKIPEICRKLSCTYVYLAATFTLWVKARQVSIKQLNGADN